MNTDDKCSSFLRNERKSNMHACNIVTPLQIKIKCKEIICFCNYYRDPDVLCEQ